MDEDLAAQWGVPWGDGFFGDSLDDPVVVALGDELLLKAPFGVRDARIAQAQGEVVFAARVLNADIIASFRGTLVPLADLVANRVEAKLDRVGTKQLFFGIEEKHFLVFFDDYFRGIEGNGYWQTWVKAISVRPVILGVAGGVHYRELGGL